MRLLFGQDLFVAHWLAQQIPHMAVRIPDFDYGACFGPGAAIGVVDGKDQIVAGVAFHNYDPYVRSIELSCASTTPMWAKPDIISDLLRYPFGQLHCQRCTAATPRRATSARRFLEKLGFRREGSVRRGFGSDNAIIYGLLAEEWAASPRSGGLTLGQEIGPSGATGS